MMPHCHRWTMDHGGPRLNRIDSYINLLCQNEKPTKRKPRSPRPRPKGQGPRAQSRLHSRPGPGARAKTQESRVKTLLREPEAKAAATHRRSQQSACRSPNTLHGVAPYLGLLVVSPYQPSGPSTVGSKQKHYPNTSFAKEWSSGVWMAMKVDILYHITDIRKPCARKSI